MKNDSATVSNPGTRYNLREILGQGAFGTVYLACDTSASNKKVAIKIQPYDRDNRPFVDEEYEILKELSSCVYLVSFYGIYRKENDIWFILEYCEGNTALDLIRSLQRKNRKMSEEHIGYVMKELVKGVVYLHENKIVHRDIKATNILLTKEGEVKLCDFGLSIKLKNKETTSRECIGSPCWMAPEVVTAHNRDPEKGFYDNRCDVWSIGITSIELAEGKAPFEDMHPSRILFQIVKNPPPKLEKISNWSESFHDFISECLVKYFEHRPYIMEIIEHPFLNEIPENNYHLSLEIKTLLEDVKYNSLTHRSSETVIIGKYMKSSINHQPERIIEEDLADLDCINEKTVLTLLEKRFNKKQFCTFVGDILLIVNPNEKLKHYGPEFHKRYFQKSRSENAPHIYSVADTAYQNALHHKVPQQIVLTGESASGKTSSYLHLVEHLFYIGEQHPVSVFRMKNGIKLIHALIHASTPSNNYSTRCILKTNFSFGQTGKLTGASFKILCLEKWRISCVDMEQSNFHILYYIYDGLVHHDATKKYRLNSRRAYRYLRIPDEHYKDHKPRDDFDSNVVKYKKIFSYLEEFGFSEEQIVTFFSVMAAILNLGEMRFVENGDNETACLENPEYAKNFADLMEIDEKKLVDGLTNYSLIKNGNVFKKKTTCDEARSSRDVLANNLYCRFVDYVVAYVSDKLEIGKAIFGSKYTISLLDFYGFECFKQNHFPQFLTNALNEQIQYHYVQRTFAWENQDLQSEDIEFKTVQFFDNRATLNQLLSKPDGVLNIIDDTSKRNLDGRYIMDNIKNQETNRILVTKNMEFSVAHYTGVVPYNAKEMADKNRDYLIPELIETMKESENPIIRALFANKLDKTGNLIVNFDCAKRSRSGINHTGVMSRENQFSQLKNMRTSGTIFRSICLELLKELSTGGSSGGTHFVRCIRSDLKGKPESFNRELVKQQIRALSVIETAKIRQEGFSHRVSFAEFLKRYQFLAFDFDENVEISKENCRLLLIRLKMEGWMIGRSLVCLKYYNEEYLSRLYECQVRKIVKIQSILRGFLVKCQMNKKVKESKNVVGKNRRRSSVMNEEEAAGIIQKAYRRSVVRRRQSIADVCAVLNEREKKIVRPFAQRWRKGTLLQVLMRYRAVRLNDFFNFSQQVHFYNQNAFYQIGKIKKHPNLDRIDRQARANIWLGEFKPVVLKMRFRLDEIPYFDTSILCDSLTNIRDLRDETWDSPYQWRSNRLNLSNNNVQKREEKCDLISVPYNRECEPFTSAIPSSPKGKFIKNEENFQTKPPVQYKCDPCQFTGNIVQSESMSFKEKQQMFSAIQPIRTNNRYNHFSSSVTVAANKDSELKSIPSKPDSINTDPIVELKSWAQREERRNSFEDNPPYNFQGMLRKTNFQDTTKENRRDSLKNVLNAVRKMSLSTKVEEHDDEEVTMIDSRPVYMELVPGLILEGIEVDL
ncbi:hypothetical protein ABEB36_010244 [Hypothenemus hampei]|uniref:non-specific serine/threonine protein kinase n=1 Tax=Hypothenemus hampei TaxID=57062 RepID=A0ABD1EJ11_HYPHA